MSVRIYRKPENPMQQGRNNSRSWVLEHDVPYACEADPLTGWQGSGDTRGQVLLAFATCDAAVRFAEREGLAYHVVPDQPRALQVKSYASNFAGRDVEPPGSAA